MYIDSLKTDLKKILYNEMMSKHLQVTSVKHIYIKLKSVQKTVLFLRWNGS